LFYIASIIFYLLLIAHLAECVIYREKILKSNDSPFVAFSMTLLFGVIYLGSIKDS
jgi:tellurite resistance protein TehA-like permease